MSAPRLCVTDPFRPLRSTCNNESPPYLYLKVSHLPLPSGTQKFIMVQIAHVLFKNHEPKIENN